MSRSCRRASRQGAVHRSQPRTRAEWSARVRCDRTCRPRRWERARAPARTEGRRARASSTGARGRVHRPAQFAEVEVDVDTGQVRVTRLVAVHDVGKAINPMLIEGQIEGGAYQYVLRKGSAVASVVSGACLARRRREAGRSPGDRRQRGPGACRGGTQQAMTHSQHVLSTCWESGRRASAGDQDLRTSVGACGLLPQPATPRT
ncbi:molybdopterin cofactor-binding domain-containing protein [Nocardioides hungaricus]